MQTEAARRAKKKASEIQWRRDNPERAKELCRAASARYRRTEKGQATQKRGKEVAKAYGAAWYQRNKDKLREPRKSYQRKRRYGLSDFDYNQICDAQGFACAICRQTPEEPTTKRAKVLLTDHDHRTGKVRGLLCLHCNALLGYAHDSITTLRYAIQYLLDNQ